MRTIYEKPHETCQGPYTYHTCTVLQLYIMLYEFASNFSNFASIFYRIRGKISTFSRLFLVMIVTIWCLIYDENAEFIAQAMEYNYEGVDDLRRELEQGLKTIKQEAEHLVQRS